MKKRILVVDDESKILQTVEDILRDEGFMPVCAKSGEEALEILDKETPDLVLLDIWLPGIDGLEVLQQIKDNWAFLPVVMMSGHGTVETAVKATKLGAYDFIEKPLSYEQLILTIKNALTFYDIQEENVLLRQKVEPQAEITGVSPAIEQLKEQIQLVAPTDAWVLIQGENGTGKELVAQTIHRLSRRAGKPMIELNCAAIPEELIESELFGHEKGAFTGASSMKRGKFDQANGSTLFLDEIGDMSLKTQAKILRILQEQRFERVGGNKTIEVDVRIIAATNKNLEEEIKKGRFREDLYHRLNVIPVEIPPLRHRKEDIPLLVKVFLEEFQKKSGKAKQISDGVLEAFQNYDWPGNVRELRNTVERLVILSRGDVITEDDLPLAFLKGSDSQAKVVASHTEDIFLQCNNFREAKSLFEKTYLTQKLKENGGNIKRTAQAIGIERRHLHRKIKALGISV